MIWRSIFLTKCPRKTDRYRSGSAAGYTEYNKKSSEPKSGHHEYGYGNHGQTG